MLLKDSSLFAFARATAGCLRGTEASSSFRELKSKFAVGIRAVKCFQSPDCQLKLKPWQIWLKTRTSAARQRLEFSCGG